MIQGFSTTKHGLVTVKNIMVNVHETQMEEGIEIVGDDFQVFEVVGSYDLENTQIEVIENLVDAHI